MTKDPRQGFCATQLPVTGTRDDLHCFIHFFNNEIYNNYIYLLPTNALGTHCCYRTVTSAGFCAYRVVYFVINLDFLSVFQHCSTTLILVNKVLRQNGTLYLASNLSDFSISMFQECDKWLKEYEPIKNNSSSEKTTKEIVFKQLNNFTMNTLAENQFLSNTNSPHITSKNHNLTP